MWDSIYLSYPNHILATRHQFWWGANNGHKKILSGTGVPPILAQYEKLADMEFDGETCKVLRSKARKEMLVISKTSGLLRGYVLVEPAPPQDKGQQFEIAKKILGIDVSTIEELREWYQQNESDVTEQQEWELDVARSMASDWSEPKPSLLVRFRDYREIAPGIMWPFREDRVQGSMRNGAFKCMRTYCDVQKLEVDLDLAEKVEALHPKEGDRVQDQRFQAIVSYTYDEKRTTAEIMKMVDIEFSNQLKNRKYVERLKKPFDKMIGKPAPVLPGNNWVGGKRPSLVGRPYLIHFWATWCAPCKNDLPILKTFANSGATVVGVHPSGTSVDEVNAAIKSAELPYPSCISPVDQSSDATRLAGYPGSMFPYCVLVDGKGRVAAHGGLAENDFSILAKYRLLVSGIKLSKPETQTEHPEPAKESKPAKDD